MDSCTDTQARQALDRAIEAAGGKTALMRKLNERGHAITSHNTISQWQLNGTPAKYCPGIEALTGVNRRELRPKDWADYWAEASEVKAV